MSCAMSPPKTNENNNFTAQYNHLKRQIKERQITHNIRYSSIITAPDVTASHITASHITASDLTSSDRRAPDKRTPDKTSLGREFHRKIYMCPPTKFGMGSCPHFNRTARTTGITTYTYFYNAKADGPSAQNIILNHTKSEKLASYIPPSRHPSNDPTTDTTTVYY